MREQASTSSFHYHFAYDVFINFRGKDTRLGFAGNLFRALTQKGVHAFFDDKKIRQGDEITPTLLKAIEESRMAVTIFSKNYASSIFCLKELVKICQCIKGKDRLILPIFYDVEPSEVRHQSGNYGQAFAMHRQNSRANEETMQSWKLALIQTANLSGKHFNLGHGQYEYQVIEQIVKEISSRINRVPLHIAESPVGLDSRILQINSLLQLGSNEEVIMVGICGIGGMGKTTIARAVYNSIAENFEGLCFLHDIKENSKILGLAQMQERMLSKILGEDIKIVDVNEGVTIIKRRLKQKKTLLILDNVDELEQLKKLAGGCDWFCSGSRIIITTRDTQVLLNHEVKRKYDMEALNDEESLELLIRNAFKNKQFDPSYKKVVNRVISYAKGLPLALEVIGSHLCGKGIGEWESALDVYERIPNEDIQQKLKVSYDGLKEVEKEIFLDIACCFQGRELKYVKDMVENVHGFDPTDGIRVLVDKSLIKIEKDYLYSHIKMHDLIKDIGRGIVRQESPKESRKRSRLWSNQDIVDVLEKNTGTNEVNIIISNNLWESIDVDWDGEAFKNMKSLKILILGNLKFSKGPKYLPNSLKVLKWWKYPSSSLPYGFCPKKLVMLELGGSCFNSMDTIKKMENLTVLTLKENKYIIKIPNLFGLSNLKELRISYCDGLIEVDDSFGSLRNLEIFDVHACRQLHTFVRHITSPFLKVLSLRVCPRLKNFPEIMGELMLRSLELRNTGIEKLPSSICRLTQLCDLGIYNAGEGVIELPGGLLHLQELQEIYIWAEKLVMDVKSNIVCPNKIAVFSMPSCNISNENLQLYLNALRNVQCLDLLLRKQLIGAALLRPPHDEQYLFCVPGESIPEWIDHRRKGPSVCFWFRNSFPTLCYCAYSQTPFWPEETTSRVYVNFESVYEGDIFATDENHIALYDLKRDYFDDNAMKRVLQEGVWNHAEVLIAGRNVYIEESGIYVMKRHCNTEDIRFTPPPNILDRFIPPPEILDSLSGDQDCKTPESPYAEDDDESPYDEYDHESPYAKWCDACSYGCSPLTYSLEEGTEYSGSMLNKKRPLIEDDNVASSSIPFSCTKRRRNCSINEDENDANTAEINSANAIENIGNNNNDVFERLWGTTFDGNDVNKASLPMLPWTEHTDGSHNSEENNWLSLRPSWETPLDYGSTSHQETSEDMRKAKGKEIVVYNDNTNEK